MREEEKIFNGILFSPGDPELKAIKLRSHKLSAAYSRTDEDDVEIRAGLVKLMLAEFGEGSFMQGPVFFHYGKHTKIGKRCFFNYNLTIQDDAPVVIGVGPGFTVGIDCHAAVETMRGHTLGRALYTGSPLPNTGIPGLIGGRSGERVLRAPADGIFEPRMEIGQLVQEGEIAATVNGKPMRCTLTGCLRGLLQGGLQVHEGMKCGDIDPRGQQANCFTASDKATAIGGGVLEALLHFGCLPD